jgi:hypothetical protein
MRVVMIAATEAGILVCTSAHDGFLIIAPTERLEADIARMTLIMQAASEALFGIPMFVDCDEHDRAVWPNRLVLGGELHPTWKLVQRELHRVKQQAAGKRREAADTSGMEPAQGTARPGGARGAAKHRYRPGLTG